MARRDLKILSSKAAVSEAREKGRLSTVKYERHTLPDSLWLFLILPTPAHWSDP